MPSLTSSQHAFLTCSEHALLVLLALLALLATLYSERVVEATVVEVRVVEVALVVVPLQVKTDPTGK